MSIFDQALGLAFGIFVGGASVIGATGYAGYSIFGNPESKYHYKNLIPFFKETQESPEVKKEETSYSLKEDESSVAEQYSEAKIEDSEIEEDEQLIDIEDKEIDDIN